MKESHDKAILHGQSASLRVGELRGAFLKTTY